MADNVLIKDANGTNATVGTKDVGAGREIQWVLQWVPTALATGRKSGIGTGAGVQLIASSTPALTGVVIKAGPDNTGRVYVGPSTVTVDAADATDGFPLWAGETITLQVADANLVYVRADTAAQKVFWAVV